MDLLLKYRDRLEALYASDEPDDAKRAGKRRLFAELKAEYAALKTSWGGFAGYDRYFAQELTNAHLASVGAYNILVPAFDALLVREGGDFPRFYAEVRRLARLPKERARGGTARPRGYPVIPVERAAGYHRSLRSGASLQRRIHKRQDCQGERDGSVLAQELSEGRACRHRLQPVQVAGAS